MATRQHGVVSTRQLATLGYSPSSASKAHGVGRLRRIHRGVYAVGHDDLTWHGRCMAAVLAVRPSVASHFSAGWLWGLLRTRADVLHVTAPTPRRRRAGFVAHVGELDPREMTFVEGIPSTSAARTLLDLAAVLSERRLETALERADERRRLDLVRIEAVLARNPHHRAHGVLGRALALYSPILAVTRSDVEKAFLEAVLAAGLPRPATNLAIHGLELDAYWERERVAVEIDTFSTHGSRAAFERDRARDQELALHGIAVVRVTDVRLARDPGAEMRRLTQLLARRRP